LLIIGLDNTVDRLILILLLGKFDRVTTLAGVFQPEQSQPDAG
jgi:hypothetical protein